MDSLIRLTNASDGPAAGSMALPQYYIYLTVSVPCRDAVQMGFMAPVFLPYISNFIVNSLNPLRMYLGQTLLHCNISDIIFS